MLFITNRSPAQSNRSRINRSIRFPLANNDVSQSVYYCQRNGKDDYVEVGSSSFMQRLKDAPEQQVLFYLHGFSNLPEPDIFPRAQLMQDLFDRTEAGLVKVVPLIWPCDDDAGVVGDYWDDQKAADQSGIAFARVLQKFLEWRNRNDPWTRVSNA